MVSLWSRSSRSRRSRSPLASAHLREYQDSPGISQAPVTWRFFFFKSHPKLNRVIKTSPPCIFENSPCFFCNKVLFEFLWDNPPTIGRFRCQVALAPSETRIHPSRTKPWPKAFLNQRLTGWRFESYSKWFKTLELVCLYIFIRRCFDQYRFTAAIQHAWIVNFISSYNSSYIYILYICIHIYIYMNIYTYICIYIISFFTSISRESSELLTAPLRLGAACMMATVECPRHLSAPLLLPEASQHVAHAYVWSSPGDNIKFPLFCPLFSCFISCNKALNGLYRM